MVTSNNYIVFEWSSGDVLQLHAMQEINCHYVFGFGVGLFVVLCFGWFLFNQACLMAELYLHESKSVPLLEAKI